MKTTGIADDTCSITSSEVRDRTGRSWVEWRSLLDDWGAADKRLSQIVSYLTEHHYLDQSWSQVIAVYYRRLT